MLESLLRSVLVEADRRNEDVLVRAFERDSKPKLAPYIYAPYISIITGSTSTSLDIISISTSLLGRIDPWDKEICSKCDDYKPCHCEALKVVKVHDTIYCTPDGCNWCGECYTRKRSECDLHHMQDCRSCA